MLQLFRKTIIRRMEAAGFGYHLQNQVLHALCLVPIKHNCIVLTPYFKKQPVLPTENDILTEGEFFMYPDWEHNASSLFNKDPKLNKSLSIPQILDKTLSV